MVRSVSRIVSAAAVCLMLLGSLGTISAKANAQGDGWKPNAFNTWMANRYHRKHAGKRTTHRASARHARAHHRAHHRKHR